MKKFAQKYSLIPFILGVIAAFLFFADFGMITQAYTGNYSKSTGEQLTTTDWNNLPNDFLDKQNPSGDTMAGPLTLPGAPTQPNHAVNLATLNDRLGGISGNRIYCGQTTPGSTAWQQWGTSEVTIYVDVNTSAAGFTGEPIYLAAISGNGNHFMTLGTQSVYNTTASGFTVYITKTTTPSAALANLQVDTVTPSLANTWGWHIHWCGMGN